MDNSVIPGSATHGIAPFLAPPDGSKLERNMPKSVCATCVPVFMAGALATAHANTYTVTTTADSGAGSLREAIELANSNPGLDHIDFAIGNGVQTITPSTGLPSITDPLEIDGTTQPGFAGAPLIAIDGGGQNSHGLVVSGAGSAGSTIRSIVVTGWVEGIHLDQTSDCVVAGCYAGIAPDGATARPNGAGIGVYDSLRCRVGGTAAADRNVASGNATGGIICGGSTGRDHSILGNYAGLDATGTLAVRNGGDGIGVWNHPGGDLTAIEISSNVCSGNGGNGIGTSGHGGCVIRGNLVGLDASGAGVVPNESQIGIRIGSDDNLVGGPLSAHRNHVAGHSGIGIFVDFRHRNRIENNAIGSDLTGAAAAANGYGIVIGGTSTQCVVTSNLVVHNQYTGIVDQGLSTVIVGNAVVDNDHGIGTTSSSVGSAILSNYVVDNRRNGIVLGGTDATAWSNAVTQNAEAGVVVVDCEWSGMNAYGNRIDRNSIWNNGGLAIDLVTDCYYYGDGVTPNDLGDLDVGPNGFQDFPVLEAAANRGGGTWVVGELRSKPHSTYEVAFYSAGSVDPSRHGEARTPRGRFSVTTDGVGEARFILRTSSEVPVGHFVSATATDADGNTSELSHAQRVR